MQVRTPPEPFDPLLEQWPSGRAITRIHPLRYAPASFNSSGGTGRFGPLLDPAGALVPTLYGGDSFDSGVSESVFHDLPITSEPKYVPRAAFEVYGFSELVPTRDLAVVNFKGHGLRRLGITHGELIESGPAEYAQTALWGAAAYAHPESPDGIVWVSRQFPGGIAVMLFGDRCAKYIEPTQDSPYPLAYGHGFDLLCAAANDAGVVIVEP